MIVNALAGIAVKDLDAAIDWYARLIGRAPDQRPMPVDAEYGFDRGGWMQIFADERRAGQSSVTLVVDDLDAEIARLRGVGIETGEPSRSDYADTAILHDPDGNQIVLAQATSAANRAAR